MSLPEHVQSTTAGLVGVSTAGGFTVIGFITESVPVLQAISLVVGIIAAIMTTVYYYVKVREKKDAEE
jgi:hypothetical protein